MNNMHLIKQREEQSIYKITEFQFHQYDNRISKMTEMKIPTSN